MQTSINFEKEKAFAQKLANTFLGTRSVKVRSGDLNIAYCNVVAQKIMFKFDKIFLNLHNRFADNKVLFDEMMVFKGLLFHEIHHIKYTFHTKKFQGESKAVIDFCGFLEDGRIETLAVLKFEKLADYFIYPVNNILVKDFRTIINDINIRGKPLAQCRDTILMAYFLLYGRKIFLQDLSLLTKLRTFMLKMFGHELVDKIDLGIDNYIKESSCNTRVDIAKELYDLLSDKVKMESLNDSPTIFWVTEPQDKKDKSISKELVKDMEKAVEVQDKMREQLKEQTKDVDGMEKERQEFADKKEEIINELREKRNNLGKKKDDKWKEYYDVKDDKKRKTIKNEIDAIDKKTEKVYEDIKDTRMSGFAPEIEDLGGELGADNKQGVVDLIKGMIEKTKQENEELSEKHTNDLSKDLQSIGKSLDGKYADSQFEVTSIMTDCSTKIEHGLNKQNMELKSGYVSGNVVGKVNIKSYINRKNVTDNKVFNKFMPDNTKGSKLLINVYIDGSGSMSTDSKWSKALKCLWVVNNAMSKDQNKVMCYQFSTGFMKFKDYDEIMRLPEMLSENTFPSNAILNSIPIIEEYRKKNGFKSVIDVIITDGAFSKDEDDNAIQKLNDLGHETILIQVDEYNTNKHKAKHFVYIKDFDEMGNAMINIFKKIKLTMIKQITKR